MWRLDALHLIAPHAIPSWVELAGPGPIVLRVEPASSTLWISNTFRYMDRMVTLELNGHHRLAIGHFPVLTSLSFFSERDGSISHVSRALSEINPTSHPQLFRIHIEAYAPYAVQSYHPCPTVRDLVLTCLFLAEWRPMLTAYAPTLVCLMIDVDSPHPFPSLDLELPVLVVLTLLIRHRGLRLVTPRLRFMISIDGSFLRLIDPVVTTRNVVSLAWTCDNAIPANHFPALRRLVVQSQVLPTTLGQLFGPNNICPDLSLLVVTPQMKPQDLDYINYLSSRVSVYEGPLVNTLLNWRFDHLGTFP